ncbi:MAG: class D sortase [Gammaproteobacteria bacterium]|jgi:sortase A
MLSRVLGAVSLSFMAVGVTCLSLFAVATVDASYSARAATSAFDRLRQQVMQEQPDQELWSDGRRAGYMESLAAEFDAPPALLRIPAIDLTVPVFEGTSELVLNRGVGRIEGTARLGSDGNVGIAGHRDGYFRGLKDLQPGSVIEVETLEGPAVYRVSDITIVYPEDVYVLDPTDEPAITLVTCYPFYFVGHAPQRYIVRAVLDDGRTLLSERGVDRISPQPINTRSTRSEE